MPENLKANGSVSFMRMFLSNSSTPLRVGIIFYSFVICGNLTANAADPVIVNSFQNNSLTVDDTRKFVNGKVVSGHITTRVGRGDRVDTYVDGTLVSSTPIEKPEWAHPRQTPFPVAEYIIKEEDKFRLFQGAKSVSLVFPEYDGTVTDPQITNFVRGYKGRLEERLTQEGIKIDKSAPLSVGVSMETIDVTLNNQKVVVRNFKLQVYSWTSLSQTPRQNFWLECWSSGNNAVTGLNAVDTDLVINNQISQLLDDYHRANPFSALMQK